MPAEDQHLVSAIRNAHTCNETLVMDDVFRLIDCRSLELADTGLKDLMELDPPIYSIHHRGYPDSGDPALDWSRFVAPSSGFEIFPSASFSMPNASILFLFNSLQQSG